MKTLYEELGVTPEVGKDELKAAYRRLAKVHHPDRPGGDVGTFQQLERAYRILSDEAMRKEYDETGQATEVAQSLRNRAAEQLTKIFMEMLNAPDFDTMNYRKGLEETVKAGDRRRLAAMDDIRRKINRLEKGLSRLKHIEGEGHLHVLLHKVIEAQRKGMVIFEEEGPLIEEMLKLLGEYDYSPSHVAPEIQKFLDDPNRNSLKWGNIMYGPQTPPGS